MEDALKHITQQLDEIRRATLLGAKDVLTTEECSLFTGYSVESLRKFTNARKIPHFKRGRLLFFSKRDVEAWLTEHPVRTNDEIRKQAATYVALRPAKTVTS